MTRPLIRREHRRELGREPRGEHPLDGFDPSSTRKCAVVGPGQHTASIRPAGGRRVRARAKAHNITAHKQTKCYRRIQARCARAARRPAGRFLSSRARRSPPARCRADPRSSTWQGAHGTGTGTYTRYWHRHRPPTGTGTGRYMYRHRSGAGAGAGPVRTRSRTP